MKSLNQAYVRYINKKYKRKGHLLTEWFHSKIIETGDYLLTVSAYIHSNPKDLSEYKGKEFDYPYSSMQHYLGKAKEHEIQEYNRLYAEQLLLTWNQWNSKEVQKYFGILLL